MNRQWIGIDISPTAVNIMMTRVRKATRGAATPKVVGLPVTVEDLRELKPFEFQNWVIQKFWGTHSPRKSGDMGIDGYSFMVNDPIQVKQSERVGRNVVEMARLVISKVAFGYSSRTSGRRWHGLPPRSASARCLEESRVPASDGCAGQA